MVHEGCHEVRKLSNGELGSRVFGGGGGGEPANPNLPHSPIPAWYLLLLINNASVANTQHGQVGLEPKG